METFALAKQPEATRALFNDRETQLVEADAREIAAIIEAVTNAPITSPEEHGAASTLASRAAAAAKQLDIHRRAMVDPLNSRVKAINRAFGVPQIAVSLAIDRIKAKISAWLAQEQAREQRERDEVARKKRLADEREAAAAVALAQADGDGGRAEAAVEAAAAAEEAAIAGSTYIRPAATTMRTQLGATSTVERWVLSGIYDYDAIPEDLWMAEAVIEALRKELQRRINAGAREIPGCSIEIVHQVRVRT